jgi:sugar lactone lactonase YvrE
MRLRTILAALTVAALALPITPARAAGPVETVVTFDLGAGELPESAAVDEHDNVYVSLIAPVSEIRKITPSGDQSTFASFDVGGFGPLGLAVGAGGDVYVAVASFDPATQGVYRVSANGTATRLPGTGAISFPNDLVFDRRGNLFVTDTAGGAVWRIFPGSSAELWIQDPLLQGTGELGAAVPLGANGIALTRRQHAIIVSNTELGTLLRIRIRRDGTAGRVHVAAEDPALFGIDGIALARSGAVFAAVNGQSTIVRVGRNGITTIADAEDGINGASAVAFGTRSDRRNLFVVNFGVFSPAPTPALLKIAVGVRGAPGQ